MNKMNAYISNNNRTGVGMGSYLPKEQEAMYQKGQIMSGVISRVSDMISIDFNGREVKVPKETIHEAKEGQIRQFEVVTSSSKGIVLKELGASAQEGAMSKATFTICHTDHLYKVNDNSEAYNEKESQTTEKKEKLDSIHSRLTDEDYDHISKEGISLESYNLERLDRVIARMKEFKDFKQDCREDVIERETELERTKENTAIAQAKRDPLTKKIMMRLEASNLPITSENIEKIQSAMQQAQSVSNISDSSIAYLMKNEMEPTIHNIYIASFSGNEKATPIDSELFNQLQEQIVPIVGEVDSQGYSVTIEDAKWLLEHKIPMTGENLRNLQEMRELRQLANSDFILDQVVNAISNGQSPDTANLTSQNSILVKQALKDIAHITDVEVNKVLSQDLTLNLIHLKEALGKNQEGIGNISMVQGEIETLPQDTNIKLVSARRQLEEIRLKMTYEAGLKLMKKGVHLYTSELETIVNELRNIEDEYYHNLLKEGSIEPSQENLGIIKSTLNYVDTLKSSPMYVLGETHAVRHHISLEQLSVAGEKMQVEFQKANEAYEHLMTSPRSDMGDSIKKAFQNVPTILEDLGLEVNEANIRAVKILGYNQMELSKEAIFSMKEYDGQVQQLMDNLHPAITVQLVKEGKNPLNTPIEELNQQIQQMKEELGLTEDVKYSVFLQKLDKQKDLTLEERNAYIGIYRLLNNVEKTDGQAIGSLIKANREITLGNLLSAVRTNKAKGLDAQVDDNYGMLTDLTYESTTISQQLENVFGEESYSTEEQQQLKYYSDLNHRLYDTMTPDKMAQVLGKGEAQDKLGGLMNKSLESFLEQTQHTMNSADTMEYYEDKLEQIQEVTKDSESALKFLGDYNLGDSVNQIEAAKEFLKHDLANFKQIKDFINPKLNDAGEELLDSMEDKETMQESYDRFVDKVHIAIHHGFEGKTLSMEEAVDLNRLSNQADLMRKLSKQQYYEVPVEIDNQVVGIAVRFLSAKDDTSKVAIHMNSEVYGEINAEFKFKDNEIKGFVLSDQKETLEQLKEVCNQLARHMEEKGFQFSQLNFTRTTSEEHTYHYENLYGEDNSEKIGTKDLYDFAKLFIRNMKMALRQNEI